MKRPLMLLTVLLFTVCSLVFPPLISQATVSTQTILTESFESGALPQGWRVVTYKNTTVNWSFTNPGSRSNATGGSGKFAVIDSDKAGQIAVDAELQTPSLNFSGASAVRLTYRSFFRRYEQTEEKIAVDVSGDGGSTWSTVYGATASQSGLVTLDISAQAAGKSSVIVAFHYYDANYSWYWQIDDVKIEGIGSPGVPGNLRATATGSQIGLTWGDTSSDETSFRVERSLSSSSGFSEVGGVARDSTSYTDSAGLSCNTTYYYRVRSRNPSGDSGYSNVANATTATCAGLSTLNETFSGTSAPAGWTTVDSSNGQGIPWNYNDASMRTFLQVGNNNLVTVNGFNNAQTNAALRTPILDLSASPGVVLAFKHWFQRNTYQTARAVIGFSLDGGRTWYDGWSYASDYRTISPLQTFRLDMSQAIGGKSNVVIRFYLVGAATWAIDDVSLETTSTPATPVNVTAVASSGNSLSVLVSWKPGNSLPGVTYELRKSFDNTNWSAPATIANGVTTFQDGAVEAGRSYFYQVRAHNASGTSNYSASASVTVGGGGGGGGGGANTSQVFNITVSYYDTPANTLAKRAAIESNLRYFADAVYEMSNGVHKLGKVTIYTSGAQWDSANIKWIASCWPNAHISGLSFASGRIEFCDNFQGSNFLESDRSQRSGGYTLGHEWGHFAYSLYDEYQSSSTSNNPGSPQANDVGVQLSIMNSQYNAVDGDNRWINFSTSATNTGPTNAQYRVYQSSAWDMLKRPPSQDPPGGVLSSSMPRLYYPNLASVAPAAGQLPSIQLPGGRNAARDQLQIIWSPALTAFQTSDGAVAQELYPSIVRQLVIDHSASMSDSQLEDVLQAVEELVNRAEPGDQIGVIGYDGSARVVQPLTLITEDQASRDAIINATAALKRGTGDPAMAAALQTALNEIEGMLQAEGESTRAVYLFGTGEFGGTTHPVTLVPDYQEADVALYTFGLNRSDAAITTLQTLATETGGTFRLGDTIDELLDALESAEQDLSPIVDVNIDTAYLEMSSSEPAEVPFYVDDTLSELEIEIVYQGDPETASFELVDPKNKTTQITDCEGEEGDDDFDQITICYHVVEEATPGQWTLRGDTDESELEIDYWIGSTTDKDDTSTFQAYIELPQGQVVSYPDPVVVRAAVAKEFPVTDLQVEASIEGPDGSFEVFELKDDGVAPDDMAQDGFYSGLLNYTVDGDYEIMVYFDNTEGKGKFSELAAQFAPASDGSTRNPQLTPVSQNFQRLGEAQVNIIGVKEDDHADWSDDNPTMLNLNDAGLTGRIDYADDVDVFKVTMPQSITGEIVVRIDTMAFDMDPFIYAFAEDLSWEVEDALTTEATAGDYLLVPVPASAGQTFYVEVYHQSEEAETGLYHISVGTRLPSEQVASSTAPREKPLLLSNIFLPIAMR